MVPIAIYEQTEIEYQEKINIRKIVLYNFELSIYNNIVTI